MMTIESTMRASLPAMRFCRDALIGCLILAAAWGGGLLLLRIIPPVISAVLDFSGTLGILIALGLLVPPLTLVVFGLGRKRHGLTISPLLAVGIPAAVYAWTGYLHMLEVQNLEQRAFLKPEAKHEFVVLPTRGCDLDCMQVLTETNYSVVGHDSASDAMMLYRKASGDVCYQPDNIAMLVAFTRAGYAGLCSIKSPVKAVDDALILERLTGNSARQRVSLGSWYDGDLYSFIERTGGKDRLLGRWAGGSVRTITDFRVGPHFDDHDFYGAALGVRFSKEPVFGHDDLRARVEKLRPVLKLPEVAPEAVWAYGDLLNELRKSKAAAPAPKLQEAFAHAPATADEAENVEPAALLKTAQPKPAGGETRTAKP